MSIGSTFIQPVCSESLQFIQYLYRVKWKDMSINVRNVLYTARDDSLWRQTDSHRECEVEEINSCKWTIFPHNPSLLLGWWSIHGFNNNRPTEHSSEIHYRSSTPAEYNNSPLSSSRMCEIMYWKFTGNQKMVLHSFFLIERVHVI